MGAPLYSTKMSVPLRTRTALALAPAVCWMWLAEAKGATSGRRVTSSSRGKTSRSSWWKASVWVQPDSCCAAVFSSSMLPSTSQTTTLSPMEVSVARRRCSDS